jgi:hypothetical protein
MQDPRIGKRVAFNTPNGRSQVSIRDSLSETRDPHGACQWQN